MGFLLDLLVCESVWNLGEEREEKLPSLPFVTAKSEQEKVWNYSNPLHAKGWQTNGTPPPPQTKPLLSALSGVVLEIESQGKGAVGPWIPPPHEREEKRSIFSPYIQCCITTVHSITQFCACLLRSEFHCLHWGLLPKRSVWDISSSHIVNGLV